MYGTPSIVITMTPQELSDMMTGVVENALRNYTPPVDYTTSLPEYPSRKETIEFLGISYPTLSLWSKDTSDRPAILVPHKIGSRIRYRRDEVIAAMKESRRFRSTVEKAN